MDHQSVLSELVSDAIPTLKVSTPAQNCLEDQSAYRKKIIKVKCINTYSSRRYRRQRNICKDNQKKIKCTEYLFFLSLLVGRLIISLIQKEDQENNSLKMSFPKK